MTWAEHATATLARAGHRSGGARTEVVSLLDDQHCCISAQRVHDRLRADGRRVGLASVYRALELLATHGLVHRIDRDGVAHFEPAHPGGEHHHHAICEACGRMDVFEDERLESDLHAVLERLGYDAGGHDVVLRGTCPACRAKA
jgi:Fur family transcriptional regulator, ferric uptake regulator